nr:alpha/beta hydrolase [Frankia sp. Cj3]
MAFPRTHPADDRCLARDHASGPRTGYLRFLIRAQSATTSICRLPRNARYAQPGAGLAGLLEEPHPLPIEVFDGLRAGLAKDRSQFYKELAVQFYGANRPGAEVSQGLLDQFWTWSMQSGLINAYESVKAFSETDFTEDLEKFDVPTLVLHGEDDQILDSGGQCTVRIVSGAGAR